MVFAVIGALAVALPALGLMEVADRAGPIDDELRPVTIAASATGTYHAEEDSAVLDACLMPPCTASTAVSLRMVGIPLLEYTARLVGATTEDLGALAVVGDAVVLEWQEDADHTDKRRLELVLAGRPVASWNVGPSEEPRSLSGPVALSWDARAVPAHLAEIGMVSVSTVATAQLLDAPPASWVLQATLEGEDAVSMGLLDGGAAGAVLDARVERVGLEHHDALRIDLLPEGSDGPGFPVLRLSFDAVK